MRNIIFDLDVKKSLRNYYTLVESDFNSQVNSTTTVSSAHIIYGNAIDLDRSIFQSHMIRTIINAII